MICWKCKFDYVQQIKNSVWKRYEPNELNVEDKWFKTDKLFLAITDNKTEFLVEK